MNQTAEGWWKVQPKNAPALVFRRRKRTMPFISNGRGKGSDRMDHNKQEILKRFVASRVVHCRTAWEDDDGYRTMPKSEIDFYSRAAGRPVSLSDFYVSTGGYNDGQASPREELVNEIVASLTEEGRAGAV
jgi:hypothetical protein